MSKLIRRIANYELSLMPDDYKQGCHFGVQQGEGAFADLETGVLPISPAVMQVLNVTLLGRPVAYAEVDGELQFWPTPDAEYHIRTYIPRETAPWGLRYSQ